MVKNHLKAIAAPKSWPVLRKRNPFILRPNPATHRLEYSLSLNFFLIDLAKLARTKRESTFILQNKEVLVDKMRRTDRSYPVGLFDVVSLPQIKKHFRLLIDGKGTLLAKEIDQKEAAIKPYKIEGKVMQGKKTQLNLSGGKNMLVEKDEYKVGGTLIIDLDKNAIREHFPLEKGNSIFLTGGKSKSQIGKVEDVAASKILYKIGDEVHETHKSFAFVVGKDKPVIAL